MRVFCIHFLCYQLNALEGKTILPMKFGGLKVMVLEKIKDILSKQFDVSADSITPNTDIAEDLGADSLDVVDVLMSLEETFDVEIPDEEIENLTTVSALVSYIEEHI